MDGVALFSIGSDGTDGPTDAAGGYVDGKTCEMLRKHKTDIYHELRNNNAYATLEKCDGPVSYTHLDVYKRQYISAVQNNG